MVNIYNFYPINLWSYTQGADFTLENSSFSPVKLNKNADPDKCSYSGYGIGFDAHAEIFCYPMVASLVKA